MAGGRAAALHYQPAIDGLRAVAVLLLLGRVALDCHGLRPRSAKAWGATR